jgi:hypothetical protein
VQQQFLGEANVTGVISNYSNEGIDKQQAAATQ